MDLTNLTPSFFTTAANNLVSPSTAPQTGSSGSGTSWFGTLLADATDAFKSTQNPKPSPSSFSLDKLGTIISDNVKLIVIGVVLVGLAVAAVVGIRAFRKPKA